MADLNTTFLVEIPVQALQSTLRALTATRDQLNLQIQAIAAQLPKVTSTVAKNKSGGIDWDSLRRSTTPAKKSKSNPRPHVA